MEVRQDDEKYSEIEDFNKLLIKKEDQIKKLNLELSEKDIILSRTKSYLFDLESNLDTMSNKINSLEADLARRETEINSKDNQLDTINSQLNLKNSQIKIIESELNINKKEIGNLNTQLNSFKEKNAQKNMMNDNNETKDSKKLLESLQNKYYYKLSELDSKEYCISCYKEQINDNNLEITYLKTNNLIRKLLSPLSYFMLLFKSNAKELSLNFKLYRALKNSECFNVGYYLNKNKDLIDSKWCKYFSPELHYVCKGFDENRTFNKKFFNRNSKKELLEYLLKCS